MRTPESPIPLLSYEELARKEQAQLEEKRKNIEIGDLNLPGPMIRFREWQSTLDPTDKKYKGDEKSHYNEYIQMVFCDAIKDNLGVIEAEQTTRDDDFDGHGDHKLLLEEGWVLKVDAKLGAKLPQKPGHDWVHEDYVDIHIHPRFLERVASGNYEAQMELALKYQNILDEFRQKQSEKIPV